MNRTIPILIGSLAATLILSHPAVSEASYRNFSAGGCQVAFNGFLNTNGQTAPIISTAGQISNDDTYYSLGYQLFCPVVGDTNISTTAGTAALNVYGYAGNVAAPNLTGCVDTIGNSYWSAAACRAYNGGGGGSCGTTFSASTSQHTVSQALNMTGWSGGANADGYFVSVGLGCANAAKTQENVFWSYELTN